MTMLPHYQNKSCHVFDATQKRPQNAAALVKNIIRSFVNGGADVELARSRPANGAFAPSDFFYGGPQRNFCRYGILSLYSLDRGDTRAFSGV